MSGFGPVTFNYDTWIVRYPEFSSTVADPVLAQEFFNEATLYCVNDGRGPIPTPTRAVLLNMLTAHIAYLNVGINGAPASSLIGRIDNASQGSVSVHAEMAPATASTDWYLQSKYGASYIQGVKPWILGGVYFPGAVPNFGINSPYPYGGGYGW